MRLYLVRHPQTEENLRGVISSAFGTITNVGKDQLEQLVNRLRKEHIDCIYTNDSSRCVETATYLMNALNALVQQDPLLRERDPGDWVGRRKEEFNRLRINEQPPNGESVLDVSVRAKKSLEALVQNEKMHDKNILIISGGLFLKLYVGSMLGFGPDSALNMLKMSNAALTIVDVLPDRHFRIECLNSRDHLAPCIQRIHITGIYGTGKTTLAQAWSKRFKLPCYSLDDIKYVRKYDLARTVEERRHQLETICSTPRWITEGSWGNFAASAFERSQLIVYLRFPPLVPYSHVLNRFFKRKMRDEQYERDSFFDILFMLQEIKTYYTSHQPISRHMHDAIVATYREKAVVIQTLAQYKQHLHLQKLIQLNHGYNC